jgi:hypothetical protein
MDSGEQPSRRKFGPKLLDTFPKLVLDPEREIAQSKVEQFLIGKTGPVGRKQRARHW